MRRALFALFALAAIAPIALAATAPRAHAQSTALFEERRELHARPRVDGYVGMEFLTLSRMYESFAVDGLARQPYVLKVADVKVSGLGGLEARVNAGLSSLFAAGGFVRDDRPKTADLGDAERYAAMLGWALGKTITLRGEARYARMVTSARPEFEPASSFPITTYYVPRSGPIQRMRPGDTTAGVNEWYTLSVLVDVDGKALGSDTFAGATLGYRLYRASLLSAYAISKTDQTAQARVLGLVEDTLACHAASLTSSMEKRLFGDLTFNGTVHASVGYARVTSQMVEPASGVCANYGGTLALSWVQGWGSLVIGYHYDELVALLATSDLALARSLDYSGVYANDRIATLRRGDRYNVLGMDQSLRTLAPFTRLTVSF